MSSSKAVLLISTFACFPLVAVSALGQILVDGKISWTDRRGPSEPQSIHPTRNVVVELCDYKLPAATQIIANSFTDDTGRYSFSIPTAVGQQRDLVVRARSESAAASIHAVGVPFTYILESPVRSNATSGDQLHVDIVGDNARTPNAAFSVLDGLTWGWQYVTKVSDVKLHQIPVEFPTAESTSFYRDRQLYVLAGDRWDWDVVLHEYGHYVSANYILDNSPGGNHSFGENLEDRLGKAGAIRLAWGEGWPTYFSVTAQLEMNLKTLGIPYVGDTRYSDTEDADIDLDLASNGDGSLGEDNEVSVMRILYDCVTDPSGTKLTPTDVWTILTKAHPDSLSSALAAIETNREVGLVWSLGAKESKHHVASDPELSLALSALPADPPTFKWSPNGAGPNHLNNQFLVQYYDTQREIILQTGPIRAAEYTPSLEQWASLKAKNVVYWVVVASSTTDPTTGPYVSSSRNLLLVQSSKPNP